MNMEKETTNRNTAASALFLINFNTGLSGICSAAGGFWAGVAAFFPLFFAVFLVDISSTAVNSRGQLSRVQNDRAVIHAYLLYNSPLQQTKH
jgi:hypothetical protein